MTILAAVVAVTSVGRVPVTVSVPPGIEGKGPVLVEVASELSGAQSLVSNSVITRRLRIQPGFEGRLEIPLVPGIWRLQARAADHWSPPAIVEVPGDGAGIALRLWRTAPLSLSITSEAGESLTDLNVAFRGSPEIRPDRRVPEGSRMCPLERGRVACDVPVGRLDLRLEARGLVPEYLWSCDISADRGACISSLRLRPGASIAGFVKAVSGEPAEDAIVEVLTPSAQRIESPDWTKQGPATAADSERSRYPLQAKTNVRGFFQICGVEPGEYQLAARRAEKMGIGSARVQPDVETRLPDFLVLEPPLELEVAIDPGTPPGGTTWTLKVVRLDPFPAELHERSVPSNRSLRVGPLGRGLYSLEVWNGAERWHNETVTIEEPPGPVIIRLPIIRVEGHMSLAGDPLAGVVVFGGRNGPLQIPMEADAEGRFQGSLPHRGDWAVSVEAATPAVTRKLRRVPVEPDQTGQASVAIALPDTTVQGRVVDEAGVGVSAMVAVYPQGTDDRSFQKRAEPDGRFVLRGLAEGAIAMEAQTPGGRRSEIISVRVADGEAQQVTLVLRGEVTVEGHVRSANGPILPGASLLAFPVGPLTGSRYYQTDAAGRFAITLPPATREMTLLYWADGHALRFFRAPVSEEPLELTADPVGGSLIVDFGRELDLLRETEAVPVVVHSGAQLRADLLFNLGLRRRVVTEVPPSAQLRRIVLPQMVPGEYAVCPPRGSAAFQNGPAEGPCERGMLTPGGELRLTVPGAKAAGGPGTTPH